MSYVYADEADMLNVVLFGKTAKEWREEHPEAKDNMRDEASIQQLLVLANMESYNAILINQGLRQEERMLKLRELAIQQLQTLDSLDMKALKELPEKKQTGKSLSMQPGKHICQRSPRREISGLLFTLRTVSCYKTVHPCQSRKIGPKC